MFEQISWAAENFPTRSHVRTELLGCRELSNTLPGEEVARIANRAPSLGTSRCALNVPWPVAGEEISVPQKSVRAVHVADHLAVAAHVETATIFTIREVDVLVVLAGVCPGQRHCGEKDYR